MLDLTGVLDAPAQAPAQTAAAAAPTQERKPRGRAAASGTKGRQFLYFDLETVPDESRMDAFGLEPIAPPAPRKPIDQCPPIEAALGWTLEGLKKALYDVNPCDEWLDQFEAAENAKAGKEKPRKGALDAVTEVREQSVKHEAAIAERQKLLSVTPEFNKIVAAGWCLGGDLTQAMVVGAPLETSETTKVSEIDVVDRLWSLIESSGPIVGFNVLHFDLPTLFVRSALLGVKPPRRLDLRSWGDDVVDLMAVRYPKGPGRKLKELAMCYGFAVPAGDFDGSQVYAAWKAGEFSQIAAYVRSDVEISRKLHSLYRGFFCA